MTDTAIGDGGVIHQATIDGDGVLTGLIATNVDLPGAIALDAASFASLRGGVGRVRLVDGAWVDHAVASVPTQADFTAAVQAHLDATARERGYDSIRSAISYRGDDNPTFAGEADALFAWRSQVWTYAIGELARFTDGERAAPTIDAFIAELPAFTWP